MNHADGWFYPPAVPAGPTTNVPTRAGEVVIPHGYSALDTLHHDLLFGGPATPLHDMFCGCHMQHIDPIPTSVPPPLPSIASDYDTVLSPDFGVHK